MAEFDPGAFGPEVGELLREPRLPELGRGAPVASAQPILDALTLPPALMAGLYLHFDFWHEAHAVAQDLETPEGSYWHAILHRREPDAANAKYWFRKVGKHPVIDLLRVQCPAIGYAYTNPFDFVDFCERVRGANTPEEEVARRVQALEFQLLFDHCQKMTLPT